MRFDLFGKHAAAHGSEALDESLLIGARRSLEIHFDDVGECGQGLAPVVGHVVVERDGVTGDLQTLAGCRYQVIGFHVFQDLDHSLFGGEQGNPVFEK